MFVLSECVYKNREGRLEGGLARLTLNSKANIDSMSLDRVFYLTTGSRCLIEENAPHVRNTVMEITFTATTTTLSFATTWH